MRKYRTQILVVYPASLKDGLPAGAHLFSQKLKTFAYLSDACTFRNHLCGIQLTGLIVEEGAVMTHENFHYLLSRLFGVPDIILISEDHKETLLDVFEYLEDQAGAKDWAREIMDRIMDRVVIR